MATSTAPAAQRRAVGGGDAWTREASEAIPLSDNASVATSDAPRGETQERDVVYGFKSMFAKEC